MSFAETQRKMAPSCILQLKNDTTRVKLQYLQQRVVSNNCNIKGMESIFAKHSKTVCCKNRSQEPNKFFNNKGTKLKTSQMGGNACRIPF